MTGPVAAAIFLSLLCGLAASLIFLAWPRRLTAAEWMLHWRALTTPAVPPGSDSVTPAWSAAGRPLRSLVRLAQTDLALLQLAGASRLANERTLLRSIGRRAMWGGLCGTLLVLLIGLTGGMAALSPVVPSLPLLGALLLPLIAWIGMRRQAAHLRVAVERRLPRLLTASRVLLESGAATPEGALTAAVDTYEDASSDLIREALLARQIRRVSLEDALEQTARRYGIGTLARLADSFRMGTRYGTRMAELLAEQTLQIRRAWFASYRERVTRAPVVMVLPALVFFVAPLLVLVVFLVFAPLEGALGQL